MTEPQKMPLMNKKIDAMGNVVPTSHADLPAAPGIANPEPNHFVAFWKKVGHKIASIVTWAPSFASKVVKVVNSAEKMTPEFDAGLHLIVKDVSIIVANAALAAAQKGLNPSEDYDTLVALETLVKDFNVFWPVVAKEFDTLEGIFHEPGVPVTNEDGFPPATPAAVADTKAAYVGKNVITPEMLGASQASKEAGTTSGQFSGAVFTPKVPKES